MMQVWEMGMPVRQGQVLVPMAVWFFKRVVRTMLMLVMFVMNMAVLMLLSHMSMFMFMTLGQM
jgi:hypothetical protein